MILQASGKRLAEKLTYPFQELRLPSSRREDKSSSYHAYANLLPKRKRENFVVRAYSLRDRHRHIRFTQRLINYTERELDSPKASWSAKLLRPLRMVHLMDLKHSLRDERQFFEEVKVSFICELVCELATVDPTFSKLKGMTENYYSMITKGRDVAKLLKEIGLLRPDFTSPPAQMLWRSCQAFKEYSPVRTVLCFDDIKAIGRTYTHYLKAAQSLEHDLSALPECSPIPRIHLFSPLPLELLTLISVGANPIVSSLCCFLLFTKGQKVRAFVNEFVDVFNQQQIEAAQITRELTRFCFGVVAEMERLNKGLSK